MSLPIEDPSDWQLVLLDGDRDVLVADLVPLAPEQTGLLSIRFGVADPHEHTMLRECLQQCADAAVPLTVRRLDADNGSLLLLTTADGMLVVTACDGP